MKISLIVAVSANNVIGVDGGLPWHLSEDLKHFKRVTMGKPMIMGRATWESIGRALPGRKSIVMTRQSGFEAEGCEVVSSVDEALAAAGDAEEVMIIGGGEIYRLFLPVTDRIYMTRVNADVEGDTYLDKIDPHLWDVRSSESFASDGSGEPGFDIQVLDRRR